MAFNFKDYEESEAVRRARQLQEQNSQYNESQAVRDARDRMNQYEAQRPQEWTGGTYQDSLNEAMNKINNREKFSYDLNGDALYQQYKDQYMNLGKMAMADTMGQAAALTGGYGTRMRILSGIRPIRPTSGS